MESIKQHTYKSRDQYHHVRQEHLVSCIGRLAVFSELEIWSNVWDWPEGVACLRNGPQCGTQDTRGRNICYNRIHHEINQPNLNINDTFLALRLNLKLCSNVSTAFFDGYLIVIPNLNRIQLFYRMIAVITPPLLLIQVDAFGI